MDLAAHELAERAVHQLVTRNAAFALELACDDAGGEMGVILGLNPDISAREAGANQLGNLFRAHGWQRQEGSIGPMITENGECSGFRASMAARAERFEIGFRINSMACKA